MISNIAFFKVYLFTVSTPDAALELATRIKSCTLFQRKLYDFIPASLVSTPLQLKSVVCCLYVPISNLNLETSNLHSEQAFSPRKGWMDIMQERDTEEVSLLYCNNPFLKLGGGYMSVCHVTFKNILGAVLNIS